MPLSEDLQCTVGMLLDLILTQTAHHACRSFVKQLQAYVEEEVHSEAEYKQLLKFIHPRRCPPGQDYEGLQIMRMIDDLDFRHSALSKETVTELKGLLSEVLQEYEEKKLNSAVVLEFLKKFYVVHNEMLQKHIEQWYTAPNFAEVKRKYDPEVQRVSKLRDALFGNRASDIMKKSERTFKAKNPENQVFRQCAEDMLFIIEAYPELSDLVHKKQFQNKKSYPYIRLVNGQHGKLELQFLASHRKCDQLFNTLSTTLTLAGVAHTIRQIVADNHKEYTVISYAEHAPLLSDQVAALFAKRYYEEHSLISPDTAALRFQLYQALEENGFFYHEDFLIDCKRNQLNILWQQKQATEGRETLKVLQGCLQLQGIECELALSLEQEEKTARLVVKTIRKLPSTFFEIFQENLFNTAPAEVAWREQFYHHQQSASRH